MIAALGDREAFLCREATKLHEEYVRASLSSLRERLVARDSVKGEIVLVVAGAPEAAPASEDPVSLYRRLAAEGRTRREAVKEAARRLGRPAREVYSIVQDAEAEDSSRTRNVPASLQTACDPGLCRVIGSAQGSSSAQGNRGLQTREPRWPLETPDAARVAWAASNPP